MRKSGLADSPFFTMQPAPTPPAQREVLETKQFEVVIPPTPNPVEKGILAKPDLQTSRVTEFQTTSVPDQQSNRLPEFESYDVPDYRKMQRIEVRLTWEQNKYLDELEALIGRDAPEGNKSDPGYRRITKNSIIRVLVETLRAADVQVDASQFRNERDLLKALYEALKMRFSEFQTSRVPD